MNRNEIMNDQLVQTPLLLSSGNEATTCALSNHCIKDESFNIRSLYSSTVNDNYVMCTDTFVRSVNKIWEDWRLEVDTSSIRRM